MSVPLILLDQKDLAHRMPSQPVMRNRIDYSRLYQIESPIRLPGFAIKYVVKGTETYTINGRHYALKAGQYLLVGPGQQAKVRIESTSLVEGLCLSISQDVIQGIIAAHVAPDLPDMALWKSPTWSEGLFQVQYRPLTPSRIFSRMNHLTKIIQQEMPSGGQFDLPFFYSMGEDYIADYHEVLKRIAAVPAVKPSTRQELFRRVSIGRHYLEDSFDQSLSIAEAAREAMLSEYQFFRLFKNIYGISPHQYLIKKRLETSKNLLATHKMSLGTIAQKTGFADAHAFSKAFKKHFGITPGTYKTTGSWQDLTTD